MPTSDWVSIRWIWTLPGLEQKSDYWVRKKWFDQPSGAAPSLLSPWLTKATCLKLEVRIVFQVTSVPNYSLCLLPVRWWKQPSDGDSQFLTGALSAGRGECGYCWRLPRGAAGLSLYLCRPMWDRQTTALNKVDASRIVINREMWLKRNHVSWIHPVCMLGRSYPPASNGNVLQ